MKSFRKSQHLKSAIITAIVLIYLTFSGPVSAILVQITGIPSSVAKGELLPFNISVEIEAIEMLPLMHTEVIFNASGETHDDTCAVYNNLTSNCTYISVTSMDNGTLLYGQDPGYGYDYNTGSYETSGIGFGYGHSGSSGNITIKLVLNTTGIPIGSASIKAIVISGNNSDNHPFSSDTTSFTIGCTENWIYSVWSTCSCTTYKRTRTGTDQNSCGTTINRTIEESCTPSGCSSSGGGGSTYIPPIDDDTQEEDIEEEEDDEQHKLPDKEDTAQDQEDEVEDDTQEEEIRISERAELVPGIGIKDNEKLQDTLEKVIEKGNLDDNALKNIERISRAITSTIDTERRLETKYNSSTITTKMKYYGKAKVKNFIVYEKIPKEFAESTDIINVTTNGRVEIIEKDPEYAIIYTELNPGQTINISYTVDKKVDQSILEEMSSEVFAESLEIPTVPTTTQQATTKDQPQEPASALPTIMTIMILFALNSYMITKHNPIKHKTIPTKTQPKLIHKSHIKQPKHHTTHQQHKIDINTEITALLENISKTKPLLDANQYTQAGVDANNKMDQISLEIEQAKELINAGNEKEAITHIRRGNKLFRIIKRELTNISD